MHSGHSDSPLLILSSTSINELANKNDLGCEVTYKQFRGNIVYEGDEPFEEDQVREVEI